MQGANQEVCNTFGRWGCLVSELPTFGEKIYFYDLIISIYILLFNLI